MAFSAYRRSSVTSPTTSAAQLTLPPPPPQGSNWRKGKVAFPTVCLWPNLRDARPHTPSYAHPFAFHVFGSMSPGWLSHTNPVHIILTCFSTFIHHPWGLTTPGLSLLSCLWAPTMPHLSPSGTVSRDKRALRHSNYAFGKSCTAYNSTPDSRGNN
jgi:hypothetical protein